jgi:hypothetical protein
MSQDPSEPPRDHIRDPLAASAAQLLTPRDLGANGTRPAKGREAAVLELVERAAQAVNEIEARAKETEERVMALAREAIEKLGAAEARIAAAQSETTAATARAEAAEARAGEAEAALRKIEQAIRTKLLREERETPLRAAA